MKKYFFVLCALPPLSLGKDIPLSFEELSLLLDLNLNKKDLKMVVEFKKWIDIRNLQLLWQKRAIDPRGNFSSKELEENLLVKDELFDFVYDFIDKYETDEDRLKNFPSLEVNFFSYVLSKYKKGFLHRYFKFEREVRLILTAMRAKRLKKDISLELRYEDLQDYFVAYILAQKNQDVFLPPDEYQDLKAIFDKNIASPYELNKSFLQYKYEKISEMMAKRMLSIEEILGYLAIFFIIEDWQRLDKVKGQKIIDNILAG